MRESEGDLVLNLTKQYCKYCHTLLNGQLGFAEHKNRSKWICTKCHKENDFSKTTKTKTTKDNIVSDGVAQVLIEFIFEVIENIILK